MASIHPQGSSMAGPGRLAAVPEGSTYGAKTDHPPVGLYRDRIQIVDVSGVRRRTNIFGHGGSGYSSASNSCPSTNSAYSSGSASAVALECLGNQELRRIARQMVSDGYIRRMVQAFNGASPAPALKFGGSLDHALKNWFSELDVDWVLQIHDEQGLRQLLQDKSATTQELVEKWVRALTIIVAGIVESEYEFPFHRTQAIALFGKASITEMLDVVDVIITALELEKLQAVLDMFVCVCGMSYMITLVMISPDAQSIFNEIRRSLERQGKELREIILITMKEVKTLVDEDDSRAIEISQGGGEVHKNTRFIIDCITSMTKAQTSMQNSAADHDNRYLHDLINDTICYMGDMILAKSELCSDPSLRYLFLLNNSYFVAHVVSKSPGSFIPELGYITLTPECKKYMDSYLNVSWGHVLSCIPKSRFPGLIHCWINTPSLAKFESAFHKTYQAQKFWKVPDPKLRDALRRAITERVISGYRDYLGEHPELEKHVGRESSSPEVLEEMLGQLFEG